MRRFLSLFVALLLICCLAAGCQPKSLSNGSYLVDVSLSGGSGRASVSSPARLTVDGDKMTARIVWSSSHYEYMIVDEVKYLPLEGEETSTFDIPIVLDKDMEVSASTTAMGQPHLIDYTLHFDGSSAKEEK